MLRGLVKLSWLEIKVFFREPMGAFGSIGVPVLLFVVMGRFIGKRTEGNERAANFLAVKLPILAVILIALAAVLSLIAIISIYREGGILKRLRATPLNPITILSAHVVVKLLLTVATLVLLAAAGKSFYPAELKVNVISFGLAMLISTFSILSIGFVVASIVPTARFAQPIGSAVLYPMLGLSGLLIPIEAMSPGLQIFAWCLPVTHAVYLLEGIWLGQPWSGQLWHIGALVLNFIVCIALSTRIFRWE